jgi:hypothetical protein
VVAVAGRVSDVVWDRGGSTLERYLVALLVILGLAVAPSLGRAQVPATNPADTRPASTEEAEPSARHVGTWELPAIVIEGERPSPLREEERVGSYAQPRWTTHRRFPRTRVYVVPAGKVEFEYWLRVDVPRDEGPTEVQHFYEFEFGLPHRLQLDLYLVGRSEGEGGPTYLDQLFELRYAFADWGKLPGNPTLYLEYALRDDAPDKVEAKLLFGGEIATGWHWGTNLVFEGEVSGDEEEHEYSVTGGVSRTLVDEELSLGAEVEVAFADVSGDRGDFSNSVYVGPSLQYRPLPNTHLDLAPLFGVTGDSKAIKAFLNFGWEF